MEGLRKKISTPDLFIFRHKKLALVLRASSPEYSIIYNFIDNKFPNQSDKAELTR